MSMHEQVPKEEIQPFGITLIAALTAIIPLVVLLRGEARSTSILAAILGVTAGGGLFFQKAWGRWLTILYYATAIVLLLLQGTSLSVSLLSCILPFTIITYLFLPRVIACFSSKKN